MKRIAGSSNPKRGKKIEAQGINAEGRINNFHYTIYIGKFN